MYGHRNLKFKLGDSVFNWTFVVADVSQTILGADFLAAFQLLVDISNHRLIHQAYPPSLSTAYPPSLSTGTIYEGDVVRQVPRSDFTLASSVALAECKYSKLLSSRPKLTTPSYSNTAPKHGVVLQIPTKGRHNGYDGISA